MKKQNFFSKIVTFCLMLFIVSIGLTVAASVEQQVTSDYSDQKRPAIIGNLNGTYVVWEDYRHDPMRAEIYLYNLPYGPEQRITHDNPNDPRDDGDPDVSENLIVWQKSASANSYRYQIYISEIGGGTYLIGSNNPAFLQKRPAISDNRVVWQQSLYNDTNNYDIYLCDYSISNHVCTGGNRQITYNGKAENPDVSGNLIVWEDNRSGKHIYLCEYNPQTGNCPEYRITDGSAYQMVPAISGNRIVWEDETDVIYYCDYNTQTHTCSAEVPLTSYYDRALNPVISGSRVAWTDDRNYNWDIYQHDFNLNLDRRITADPETQERPAIFDRWLVWEDNRNGNWDIYATYVNDPPGSGPIHRNVPCHGPKCQKYEDAPGGP